MTQNRASRDVAHLPSPSSPTSAAATATTYDYNSRVAAPTPLSPSSTERRMRSRTGPQSYYQQVCLGQDLDTVHRRGGDAPIGASSSTSDDGPYAGTVRVARTNRRPWFSRDQSQRRSRYILSLVNVFRSRKVL